MCRAVIGVIFLYCRVRIGVLLLQIAPEGINFAASKVTKRHSSHRRSPQRTYKSVVAYAGWQLANIVSELIPFIII